MSEVPADEETETVQKSSRDFEPCSHPNCTPAVQDCEGSNSDAHHCVDCGELWWDGKADYCSICNDYWCCDYQHTFRYVSDDSDFDEDDGICPKCWGSKSDMKAKMAKASAERRKKILEDIKRRLSLQAGGKSQKKQKLAPPEPNLAPWEVGLPFLQGTD